MGKPVASDLRQGIVTLPALYFLSGGNNSGVVVQVLTGPRRDEPAVRAAVDAIRASGALEAAIAEARRFSRRGQEALKVLPDNPHRQILFELADFVVERNR